MNANLNQRDIELYIHRLESVANSDTVPGYEKLLSKFRLASPDRFLELCKMQLSFLLDIPSDVLTELSHSSQGNTSFHCETKMKTIKSGVFSNFCNYLKKVKVAQSVQFINPDAISALIKHLMTFQDCFTEGLFRKTGNLVKQRLLFKRIIEVSSYTTKSLDLSSYSQHEVACVIKSLLQRCPVIHREICGLLVEVNSLKSHDIDMNSLEGRLICRLIQAKQLKAFRILCFLVETPYRQLLLDLLQLLRVVSNDPHTKMTSSTLGTLFGPILLSQPSDSSFSLHSNYHLYAQTMEQLIDLADSLAYVPLTLVHDIKKNAVKRRTTLRTLPGGAHSAILSRLQIPLGRSLSPAVMEDPESDTSLDTCVCFTSRQSRQTEGSELVTSNELSRLYQTITELPPSQFSQKRKYIKRFARSAVSPKPYPEKMARSFINLPNTPDSEDYSPPPFSTCETPKRTVLKSWSSLISSSASNSFIRRLPPHLKRPGIKHFLDHSYYTSPLRSSVDMNDSVS